MRCYNDTLQEILDIHAPESLIRSRCRTTSPWYNSTCKRTKLETRRLERIYRSTKTEARTQWRDQFKRQRVTFQTIRTEYWSKVIQECSDSRSMWRCLNCILNPNEDTACPHSAQAFANFFDDKIETIRQNTMGSQPPVIHPRDVPTFADFAQCSIEEVTGFISKAPNKCCQMDPVPTDVVKQCSDILSPIITKNNKYFFLKWSFSRYTQICYC